MKLRRLMRSAVSWLLCIATLLSLAPVLSTPANAKSTISLTPKLAYNLNLTGVADGKVKNGHRINAFHIGEDYIYIAQRNTTNDVTTSSDTYISRLKIVGDTAYAVYGDFGPEYFVLKNCGIGETLDLYTYNNKAYFLVGIRGYRQLKSETDDGNSAFDWDFSVRIGRVECKDSYFTSHNEFNYNGAYQRSLYSLDAASGSDDGSVQRVTGAVCGTRTVVRVQCLNSDGDRTFRYLVYDTKKLNKVWDGTDNTYDATTTAVKNCLEHSNNYTTYGTNAVLPTDEPNKFRGLDLSCYYSTYLLGDAGDNTNPKIARMTLGGTYDWLATIKLTSLESTFVDIWGIKVNNCKVYFHVTTAWSYTGHKIYYINESDLSSCCSSKNSSGSVDSYSEHDIRYLEPSKSPWGCTTARTCTSAGWTLYAYCTQCNYPVATQEYYSTAKGHNFATKSAVSPGCTTPGWTEGTYCKRCNSTSAVGYVAPEYIAPIGHSYSSAVTQTASCTQKGITTYTCANCSDTYTEESEMLLHNDTGADGICDDCGGSTDVEPQSIVIDYATGVTSNILEKLVINGISPEHLTSATLDGVTVKSGSVTAALADGDGDTLNDSVCVTPSGILSDVAQLLCTVSFTDPVRNEKLTRIVPVNVVPASIVYYEAEDFVTDRTAVNGTQWSKDGASTGSEQDNGDYDTAVSELTFDAQNIPSNAFFADFNGETERYAQDYIYAGMNYDTVDAWTYNPDRLQTPVVDTTAGTITFTHTDATQDSVYFNASGIGSSNTDGFALNYQPEGNHYAIVRFKLSDMTVTEPVFSVKYYTASDRTEGKNDKTDHIQDAGSVVIEGEALAALKEGEYITVRVPLTFPSDYERMHVTALRFHLIAVKTTDSSNPGSMTVDYIYVGPLAEEEAEDTIAPEYCENPSYKPTEYLLFDFDNSPAARTRYTNSNYNAYSADTSTYWCAVKEHADSSKHYVDTQTGVACTVDNDRGVLIVPIDEIQSSHGRYGTYFAPTNGKNQVINFVDDSENDFTAYKHLNYTPASGNSTYLHMRIKFSGCKKDENLDPDTSAFVQISLFNSDQSQRAFKSANFVFENDKWIDVFYDMTSDINRIGTLCMLYFRLANIVKSGSSDGTAEIDYIYIGPEKDPDKIRSAQQSNVMIDFDNGDYDKNRYAGELYGGVNLDAVSVWNTADFTHSISNGTMTLTPTSNATGHEYGFGSKIFNSGDSTLNYTMTGADYIVVRAKAYNLTAKKDSTPSIGFYFDTLNGTSRSHTGYQKFELDENGVTTDEWQTFVFDISEYADRLKVITILFPTFRFITYGDGATIEIDYIYLGTLENGSAPADALYFGFGNRLTDQQRYNSYTYSGINYDDPGAVSDHYYFNTSEAYNINSIVIDNQTGTMTLTMQESMKTQYVWFDMINNASYQTWTLNYHPQNAEIFQIRFKMENLARYDSSSEASFKVQYFTGRDDDNDTYLKNLTGVTIPDRYLTNGEYITLTIRLDDDNGKAFCNTAEISRFRTFFSNLANADGEQGKITIDYIYVGPGDADLRDEMTYGSDNAYAQSTARYSNSAALTVEGAGVPLIKGTTQDTITYPTSYTEASFTFTGTGFDIISRTGPDDGALRVVVIDSAGNIEKVVSVLNKSDGKYYQTPVINVTGLEHGTYTVKIFVNAKYENSTYPALNRGGTFIFDAIRIYNTVDTSTNTLAYGIYQDHGEADAEFFEIRGLLLAEDELQKDGTEISGAVYVDRIDNDTAGTTTSVAATYASAGPNNEVYLKKDSAVVFKLQVDEKPSSVDIGMKKYDTDSGSAAAVTAKLSNYISSTDSSVYKEISVTSNTEQYYSLDISNWAEASGKYYVYIKVEAGADTLCLTNIKVAYDTAKTDSATRSVQFLVDPAMIAAFSGPAYDSALSISMNVGIGEEMQVTYTVPASIVADYDSFYLEVVKEVADGESVTTTYSLADGNLTEISSDDTLVGYSATFTGVKAMEMGDTFYATLYGVDADGNVFYGDSVSASIRDCLLEKLNDSESSDELKTLAVDMLNYGAAAQTYFGYDADNLVNADLTDEQKLLGTQAIPAATDTSSTSGNGGRIVTGVSLQSKVLLYVNCVYAKSDDSNLEFVVRDATTGEELERFAPTVTTAKICQGVYSNVGARQMRDLITVELYDNGVLVSQTLTWDIESYVAQVRADSNSSDALIATVNAMLTYGDSAAAYLTASGQ